MKFSWGTGITIVIVLFMTAIISLVAYAFTFDVNLVADNYYEQEIKHQEQIDKKRRSKQLSEQVKTVVKSDSLLISFPSNFKNYEIDGKITLYRPSDHNQDIEFAAEPDAAMRQVILTNKFTPGLWRVQIDWSVRDSAYFNEKVIMIN